MWVIRTEDDGLTSVYDRDEQRSLNHRYFLRAEAEIAKDGLERDDAAKASHDLDERMRWVNEGGHS